MQVGIKKETKFSEVIRLTGGATMIKTGEQENNYAIYSRLEKIESPAKDESAYIVSPNTSKLIPAEVYEKLITEETAREVKTNITYDFSNKELFETIY